MSISGIGNMEGKLPHDLLPRGIKEGVQGDQQARSITQKVMPH